MGEIPVHLVVVVDQVAAVGIFDVETVIVLSHVSDSFYVDSSLSSGHGSHTENRDEVHLPCSGAGMAAQIGVGKLLTGAVEQQLDSVI